MNSALRGAVGVLAACFVGCAQPAVDTAVEVDTAAGARRPEGVPFDLAPVGQAADPPPLGTLRFAVIGDYGVDEPQEGDVAALVDSWGPEFVLTVGDNNYGGGTAALIDDHVGKYYEQYIGNYQGTWGPGSPTNRFWPTLGNHDWDAPGAAPYLAYFSLPGNERYYDFVEGPVHFFAIDSDTDEPAGATASSAQAAWLQASLAASTSPWNVVYFHHCPYSSSSGGDQTTRMRWPFEAWGADLVLSGHHHAYERLAVGGLPYVVNGLGGAGIEGFGPPVPGSLVRYAGDWGALRVDATDTDLRLWFVTRGGVVVDTFVLAGGVDPVTTTFQQGVSPTAAYAGTTDATIDQGSPTTNAGSAARCRADGNTGTGADLACLLRFDVSTVPTGSTVTDVSLSLYVTNPSPPPAFTWFGLRRSWVESQVTWNLAALGSPWQVPGAGGADDRGDAVATIGAATNGRTTFPLGPAGVALVQGWVDDPAANFGVVLAHPTNANLLAFASSEAANVANRPQLVVTWLP